jgi:hypothetical protein
MDDKSAPREIHHLMDYQGNRCFSVQGMPGICIDVDGAVICMSLERWHQCARHMQDAGRHTQDVSQGVVGLTGGGNAAAGLSSYQLEQLGIRRNWQDPLPKQGLCK